MSNGDLKPPCPMCGQQVSIVLTACPVCGEQFGTDRRPLEVPPEAATEVDYWALVNLLGIIWMGWGLFSGCAGLMTVAEIAQNFVPDDSPSQVVLMCVAALTWFVSGLATLQKEIWGIYLGYVFSYVMLVSNLIYLNPIGTFVAVGFILLSRLVLKKYRQLKGSGIPADNK